MRERPVEALLVKRVLVAACAERSGRVLVDACILIVESHPRAETRFPSEGHGAVIVLGKIGEAAHSDRAAIPTRYIGPRLAVLLTVQVARGSIDAVA